MGGGSRAGGAAGRSEQGRPAGVGVLAATKGSEFGLVSDLVVLLEQSEAGAIERLDDFLAMLSRQGTQ